ncbi:hypothetical protein NPIL_611561 [Nephila pilipes]|uniref:Spider venom protein n=1 Tax=Nephila pilipes TaxID=299642 RepID=A0A8X6NK60_NEPPI|nr:hypothetical protein NPIL_611561 [Nephila pilipes]
MFFGSVYVLLLALLAISVFAQSEENGDNDVLSVLNCIAESGDQALCDGFLDCKKYFPQSYADADVKCEEQNSPDGPGNCNKDEFFGGADSRDEINQCIEDSVPEELSDEEKEQLDNYTNCINDLGKQCSGENN